MRVEYIKVEWFGEEGDAQEAPATYDPETMKLTVDMSDVDFIGNESVTIVVPTVALS